LRSKGQTPRSLGTKRYKYRFRAQKSIDLRQTKSKMINGHL